MFLLHTSTGPATAEKAGLPAAAHWIAAGAEFAPATSSIMPVFRRSFLVRSPPLRATLKISGLGQFEAHLNGSNITANRLTPGWTDYTKHVFYDTYDVAARLHTGENVLGVMLGNGMFNLLPAKGRYTKIAGSYKQPRMIASLTIVYRDNTTQTLVTNPSWQVADGPIVLSSAYGGEDYDARRELHGWDLPGQNSAKWHAAVQIDSPGGILEPESSPPVKAFDGLSPLRIAHPSPGVTVYDLGQNIAGWPEIEVQGTAGAQVKLVAGELLDDVGLVSQRSANAFPADPNVFTYTLRGGPPEHWHPRFSYYGFRYVQAMTADGDVRILSLTGRTLHDDIPANGTFTSSSDLLNRIHRLIDRAMLSNLFSVITDCPQREKLGWLEQTHLAGAALLYNFGLAPLYAKISDDMQDAQTKEGLVPDIAPEFDVFPKAFRDSPEWGSAVVLSPWIAYQFYGDLAPLRAHYNSMQRYAAYLKSHSENSLLTFGLGDWYDIGPGHPGLSKLTSPGVTATATYYELLVDLSRIGKLLHRSRDAATYKAEAADVRLAFNARFFHPQSDTYDTGSQTANAMPLVVGLAPQDHRDAILANLVADIRAHGDHVTAGDIGFHYVVRALTDGDRSDVLLGMLLRTDSPSYGYQLAQGATTLTEAWDANPSSSQNHLMLGHAEDWFYRGLAGIQIDLSQTGADRLRFSPSLPGDLQHAGATYDSVLGQVSSTWQRSEFTVRWTVHLPVTSTIVLPVGYRRLVSIDGKRSAITAGAHRLILRRGSHVIILARL